MLTSCMCTQGQLISPTFERWGRVLLPALGRVGLCDEKGRTHLHRKLWEWCYIAEALDERGMLWSGRKGLAFAVGQEPLAAAFASLGCRILATDLDPVRADAKGWVATNQHADSLASLNAAGLCDPDRFRERVSFRFVDMNAIPDDLQDGAFDFVWSSCSIEHLGSLELAERFVTNAMHCLKPGGVSVHTTEYNLSSNDDTIAQGDTVLFRRRDIESLARRLRLNGHHMEIDFTPGGMPGDSDIDVPPYRSSPHLRLQFGAYVITSYGLIARKGQAPPL